MGVCGSKTLPERTNGPVDRYDDVDGPVLQNGKKSTSSGRDNTESIRNNNVSENGTECQNDRTDNDAQLGRRADEIVKAPSVSKDENGESNTATKFFQQSEASRRELEVTGDENDQHYVGNLPVERVKKDLNENVDIIDLEEEFKEDEPQLEQAYSRQPPTLSKKYLLEDVYRMDFTRRGRAIIINNETFQDMAKRKGTQVDCTRICDRLKKLGFQTARYQNVTGDEIMQAFRIAANEDYSDADCFAAVFLSHGAENEIHGTDANDIVKLNAIFELFHSTNCKSLAGKPKLFFVQTCRGEEFDDGAEIHIHKNVVDAACMRNAPEAEVKLEIPNEADFLISYSTVKGYYSWRNGIYGSWYIQALVHVLDKYGTQLEIQKLLTRVNKKVANDFKSKSEAKFDKKQIPSFVSRLTKDLYFIPKQ